MTPTPRQTPDGFSDARVMAVVVFHARIRSLAPRSRAFADGPVDESRYGRAYATELSINVLTSSQPTSAGDTHQVRRASAETRDTAVIIKETDFARGKERERE